jgi:hypothetical protein
MNIPPITPETWLEASRERLALMRTLGDEWCEGATGPIGEGAITAAHAALDILERMDMPPGDVCPTVESGVGFSWRTEHGMALAEFYPDGAVVILTDVPSGESNAINAWEIGPDEVEAGFAEIRRTLQTSRDP